MRIPTQVRTLYLVLVAIQVATSLAGIALLGRMSPAIGEVLAANEASVEDAEHMLAALASTGTDGSTRFEAALARAEENVSEPAEAAILARVRARAESALAGETAARAAVVSDLMQLSEVNREAMHRADEGARRLGLAGRWALALLALLGLFVSAFAMRQARLQLIAPLTELVSVLHARRSGDHHRRYVRPGPGELALLLSEVNEVIDIAEQPGERAPEEEITPLRAALAHLLDARGGALVVVDAAGELVAASRDALDQLAVRGDTLRAELRAGALEREPLGASGLALARVDPA